jgi:hypothetical protein
MKSVYLDQNIWINLRDAATESPVSSGFAAALRSIHDAREMGRACFPLSYGHRMETARTGSDEKRISLWKIMLDVSEGRTLASEGHIVACEIDHALMRLFPKRILPDRIVQLQLIGKGFRHADPLLHLLDFLGLEGDASEMEQKFADGLQELRSSGLTNRQREAFLYFRAMESIREDLLAALDRHEIPRKEFEELGEDRLRGFLHDLPCVSIDIHMHRQWAKNKDLPVKRNDPYDLVYLGKAAMYCDVVVTEKQFADLAKRDGFRCRATLLTDPYDLVTVLAED